MIKELAEARSADQERHAAGSGSATITLGRLQVESAPHPRVFL